MATYVIGDVHGSAATLRALLERVRFDAREDHLWFVGDLVNNGTGNLAVMRLVRDLGDRAVVVLGNHDLHMLAAWAGVRPLRRKDTFTDVLDAPDVDALMTWLRHRPLMHERGDDVMIHAGLAPEWSVAQARVAARAAEALLRGDDYATTLREMYGDEPARWADAQTPLERLRFTINATTRMRACAPDGALELRFKSTLEELPYDLVPWFRVPGRSPVAGRLLFGHWSALDYHREADIIGLDSGCTWGRKLTALRLEDDALFQVRAIG